ncbi:cadmium resistance transporter [Schleiferilactobacillus harbinensis]|jgi:cadmium resistance transport/sequestration family protein|uniref:cadmium resistance transporter n=1 Tax=Schleiferilactobacillus harbinensis TaxID=304207 RepID=UPI0021A733D8|nr:cadmium resistance transporter [Schleiferilactobacillus harbinensis]MCI1686757.1 cadmium resistance transporter [Schleiferilactobacillus harbinensis]MCI1782632.1 cadmium resistance transporter [Schleiferilactobacillus harbinensis]MCI1849576.1 cadmium resistance transporter [Schleiferilactobacillus harbinensis]MCT2908856.1 permease [Schleiferilactobacillus harbinensis]
MLNTIITGVTAYISTSLDYLLILMVVFGGTPKHQRGLVYVGDLVGTSILVGISLILAYALGFVPQPWLLGLLGLIPVYMGIRLLLGEEEDADEKVDAAMAQHMNVIWKVALITVTTCGADNIGIYVPLLTQLNQGALPLLLMTFLVMLTLFCATGLLLSRIPQIAHLLDRYGRYITAAVYCLIGFGVLWEGGTVQHLLHL